MATSNAVTQNRATQLTEPLPEIPGVRLEVSQTYTRPDGAVIPTFVWVYPSAARINSGEWIGLASAYDVMNTPRWDWSAGKGWQTDGLSTLAEAAQRVRDEYAALTRCRRWWITASTAVRPAANREKDLRRQIKADLMTVHGLASVEAHRVAQYMPAYMLGDLAAIAACADGREGEPLPGGAS